MELLVENMGAKTGKRVDARLSWEKAEEAEVYLVFKRKPGEEWQSISTFDFLDAKPIRVLNAYPRSEDCDYNTTSRTWIPFDADFRLINGQMKRLSKSASLKVWMEGESINGERFENVGRNLNDETLQAIEVDALPMEYVNENPQLIWNYDVFIPGIWDGGGSSYSGTERYHPVCNTPKDTLLSELRRYLDAKYSVIASHDSMGRATGTLYAMGTLREYFGIAVGGHPVYNDPDEKGVLMQSLWACLSTKASVVKRGALVDYPWTIPDTFDIYMSHTWGNIATSDVWVRVDNDTYYDPFQYTHSGSTDFYLTTRNNTAMIQTGHGECNATLYERELFANLIYFMKQRTNETQRNDYSSRDEDPPEAPGDCYCEIHREDYKFHCNGRDSETIYEYKVEAYNSLNEVVSSSSTVVIDMASNFSHFVYACNNKETMTKPELRNGGTVSYAETILIPSPASSYFHIMAVDGSGNEGPIVDYPVAKCVVILTPVFEMERFRYQTPFTIVYMFLYSAIIW